MVWNKNAKSSQTILTEAVCAPGGIDEAPITNMPNPIAKKVKPPKNFWGPENLYFSQNLEYNGASEIMNKGFNIWNQDVSTNALSPVILS